MRDYGGKLSFRPKLPQQLTHLAFRLRVHACTLSVEIEPRRAKYSLTGPFELELMHYDASFTLKAGKPVSRAIPIPSRRESPHQPAGREPKEWSSRL
jgi:alpha,alpha-trehalose phosphorylase